jgi:recombination protein RecA
MVERIGKPKVAKPGGNYFSRAKTDIQFCKSGCQTLDLALGGGWAERRIANIVGDSSSGKTLLAIEAAANFAIKHKKGRIRYREAEYAFQPSYAEALGMPLDRVDFGDQPLETVEDLFEDLDQVTAKATQPELYICDSLDALTDRAEVERDMNAGTYGAEKAKKMSQLFRRLVGRLSTSNVTLIIISQVRSKIGITFGRKTTRTGGRALDFYASQVLYLAQAGKVVQTTHNVRRATGVIVKAKCDKNKVALPYRDATFEISFGYGVNDIWACLSWLKVTGFLGDLGLTPKTMKDYAHELMTNPDPGKTAEIHEVVERRWYELETKFLSPHRKYGT